MIIWFTTQRQRVVGEHELGLAMVQTKPRPCKMSREKRRLERLFAADLTAANARIASQGQSISEARS